MYTERLYLEQPYLIEFEARIIDSIDHADSFAIVLDRSAFYPTSGGQMFDTGFINGIKVKNVVEEKNKILHFPETKINKTLVNCQIDWSRRFDFMQQHTAFHILAQSFLQVLKAETQSSHLGEEFSTIDVNINTIDTKQVNKIEQLANQICFENRIVKQYFVSPDEIEKIKLRALPTKGDKIRIVEIENFDIDPCGGTHVNSTGQVGMIKIVAWEKLRGNLRFEFFAGTRALLDYQKKWLISKDIVNLVTESEDKLVFSVEKLLSEVKKLSKQNALLNKHNIDYEVRSIIDETNRKNQKVLVQIFENRDPKYIRYLANQLIQKSDLWVLFGFKNEKAHLIFAHPECHDYNLNELLNQVAHLIEGKGGGRFNFVEAGGKFTKGIEEALEFARVIVEKSVLNS